MLATVEFYVAGDRQALCLLDVATGKLLHRLPGRVLPRVYAFSPDGELLATGGPTPETKSDNPYSVSLWDTATGRQIAVLPGHGMLIHSAAFTPDGRTLVTACYRNRVCRWDVARGELRKSFDLPLPEGRESRLSPDGSTLAVASPQQAAPQSDAADSLWDTETGKQRCTLPSRRSQHDYGLAFSPDGKLLATNSTEAGTDQKAIFMWDVETGKRVSQFKVPARVAFVLMFAPDVKTLLSSGEEPLIRQRIADLDSDDFQRREAASAELAALGDQARATLEAALQGSPSLEQRKRIEALLADPGRVRSAETLRHLRAVETLEHIGSPEARQIVVTRSQGAPDARQTREAKAALARLPRP